MKSHGHHSYFEKKNVEKISSTALNPSKFGFLSQLMARNAFFVPSVLIVTTLLNIPSPRAFFPTTWNSWLVPGFSLLIVTVELPDGVTGMVFQSTAPSSRYLNKVYIRNFKKYQEDKIIKKELVFSRFPELLYSIDSNIKRHSVTVSEMNKHWNSDIYFTDSKLRDNFIVSKIQKQWFIFFQDTASLLIKWKNRDICFTVSKLRHNLTMSKIQKQWFIFYCQ